MVILSYPESEVKSGRSIRDQAAKFSLLLFILLGAIWVPQTAAAPHVVVASVAAENKGGPDEHILHAVAEKLGTGIIFRYAPFKRRLLMLKSGHVDLVCGLLKRPEREAYIHYVLPPYKERSDTIFFVPKGRSHTIQSFDDLIGLKIGVTRGSKYFVKFDNSDQLNREIVHEATANFRKLILGRIDAMIIYESAGIDLLHKLNIADRLEIADYRFSRKKSVYFGISKASALMEDLARVESVIQGMIQSDQIRQILSAYYTSRNLPVPAM